MKANLLLILMIFIFLAVVFFLSTWPRQSKANLKVIYEPSDTIQKPIISLQVSKTLDPHLDIENKASTSVFKPISYGFTSTDAKNLFKLLPRPQCLPLNIFKHLPDGSVEASCGNQSVFGIENSSIFPEKMGKNPQIFTSVNLGMTKVLNKSSEFHFVKCEEKKDVFLRNVRNEQAAERTAEKTAFWKDFFKTKEVRPLTVVAFYIDSASRQLIYRMLPKTVEFLNEVISNNSNFMVAEFLINNAVKAFTVPNMTPINLGISISSFEKMFFGNYIEPGADRLLEVQANRSLFTHFRDLGFVTAYTSDAVAETMAYIFGRKAIVDHQVSNFWTLGNLHFGLDEFKDKDVCMGSHPPHYYTLSYIEQFMKNYPKTNKFIFAHINTAHEGTGSRLNIADNDFRNFFKNLIENFDHENEDLVFLLGGDHGTSKADFMTIEGLAERVMAAQFLIGSKNLIKRLKSEEFIKANTRLPISRYDWHKTLKFLAYAPYAELDINSEEYKKIETELTSFSLFHEIVDESRNCSDLGVFDIFCLSKKFEKVEKSFWQDDLIKFFQGMASEKANAQLTRKPKCSRIIFDSVKMIEKLSFDVKDPGKSTIYLIQVSSQSNPESRFLIHATKGDQNQYNNLKDKFILGGFRRILLKRVEKISYYTIEMVWEIYRLGPLKTYKELVETGKCENIMKFNHNLYLAEKGENCFEMCAFVKMDCNRPIFYETILEYVREDVESVEIVGEFDSLEIFNRKLVVGRDHFCSNRPVEGQGVCFCSINNENPWDGILFS
jgi:hypothetical protein